MSQKHNIVIKPGKTFRETFFYASDEPLYLPIEAISQAAPLQLSVPNHNLPGDLWPITIESAKSPSELNLSCPYFAKTIDANTLEIMGINASNWRSYNGGALLVYQNPIDLTGWAFRGQIRDKVGGNLLFSWHSDPAENPDGSIEVGTSRFTLNISPEQSANLSFTKAVYDIEAVTSSGDVYPVIDLSEIRLEGDVTAWPIE